MGVSALAFDAGAQLLELFHPAAGEHHGGPARASVRANWAPRPLDAPVTKATRPERSMVYAI
jgi:hypothetical protein